MADLTLHMMRALYVNTVMANSAEEDHLRAKRRAEARHEFDAWLDQERHQAWRDGAWTGWSSYAESVFAEIEARSPYQEATS